MLNIFFINTIQAKFLRSGFFFRNVDQHPTELAPVQVHKFPFESSAAAAAGERFDKIGGGGEGLFSAAHRSPSLANPDFFRPLFCCCCLSATFCRSGILPRKVARLEERKRLVNEKLDGVCLR